MLAEKMCCFKFFVVIWLVFLNLLRGQLNSLCNALNRSSTDNFSPAAHSNFQKTYEGATLNLASLKGLWNCTRSLICITYKSLCCKSTGLWNQSITQVKVIKQLRQMLLKCVDADVQYVKSRKRLSSGLLRRVDVLRRFRGPLLPPLSKRNNS